MLFPSEDVEYLTRRKGAVSLEGQERRGIKQAVQLLPYLRTVGARSILDIGCGLGVVDAVLGLDVIHLMDGDGTGERRDDYGADVAAWNDVRLAAEFVRLNVPTAEVYAHIADPNLTIPVDAIISLKSWGTHYPVSTYLPLAKRSLSAGGLLALDMRKGHDDSAEIEVAGFKLWRAPSSRRRVFVRCA
jgi:hypothetical protein